MARGTSEFNVQQLMDFLYAKEQALRQKNESSLHLIGQAFVGDQKEWLQREFQEYNVRQNEASELEGFRFRVESYCGELHSSRAKTGGPNPPDDGGK